MQTCLKQPIPNWDYSSHWSAGSTFPFHLVHPFSSRRTKYTHYTYIYIYTPYPLLVKHAVLEAGGSVHFGCAYNVLTLNSRVRLGCPLAARNNISHKIIADLQHDHENSAPQRCAKCTHQSFKAHLWTVQMPRGEVKWPRSQRSQVPTKPCHNLASSSLVPLTSSAGAPCGGERFHCHSAFSSNMLWCSIYDQGYNSMSFPFLFVLSNIPFKIVSQLAWYFSAKHGSVGFVFIALPPRKGVQKGAQQEPKVFMGGRDGGFTWVLLGFTKDNVIWPSTNEGYDMNLIYHHISPIMTKGLGGEQ